MRCLEDIVLAAHPYLTFSLYPLSLQENVNRP